jgi:hypothetical protein
MARSVTVGEDDLGIPWRRRFNHDRRVRLLLGDHGIVAKSPEGSRQVCRVVAR